MTAFPEKRFAIQDSRLTTFLARVVGMLAHERRLPGENIPVQRRVTPTKWLEYLRRLANQLADSTETALGRTYAELILFDSRLVVVKRAGCRVDRRLERIEREVAHSCHGTIIGNVAVTASATEQKL